MKPATSILQSSLTTEAATPHTMAVHSSPGKAVVRRLRVSLLLSLLLVLAQPIHAAMYFSTSFPYGTGTLGSVGAGDGWSGSNSGVTVSSNSLDGAAFGLPASSGNKVTLSTASSSGTYNQFSTGIITGSVYYSFLLQVNATTGLDSTGKVVTGLLRNGSASSYYVDVWLRLNNGNVEIGLSKLRGTITWRATPLTVGNTYFVVAKYQFVAQSNNDLVSLWINPVAGASEPTPVISFSTGGDGNDSTGIGRCYLYGGTSCNVDELRIASTWTEVAPGGGTPPPPSTLRFTSIANSPDGLIMAGVNGTPNAAFDLLASADPAAPLIQWNEVSAENFDPSGNFLLTNPITPTVPHLFYSIRTGSGGPPAISPEITQEPTDLDLLAGQTAQFAVTATGTAPLTYRWYFNTNTPVGGNNPSLTLNNIQTNNAGTYHVVISNLAGSVASDFAELNVSNIQSAPHITGHPQSQTVTEGQTLILGVSATGTTPLTYQWYFNTNTPLTARTNPTLILGNVTSNQAGAYSVVVSNYLGTDISDFAILTVNPPSTNDIDFSHVGFAANGMPITGGAAGPTVYVGSASQLDAYADVNPPYTIYITNSFALSGMSTHIRNNKTVIGLGNIVLSGGGLYLYKSTNVVIRNLTIQDSSEDGVGLHYSANVWIDHCTIKDCADGGIDITQQSDNVTISWCRFIYTSAGAGNHNFVSLIASSDADSGSYRTTYHHNWWDVNCVERMPSARFGRAHVFNNYYNAPGNNYCVRTRKQAECRVENNFFQNVKNPWERYVTSWGDLPGKLYATNNNVPFLGTAYGVTWTGTTTNKDNTVRMMIPGTDSVFTPPYTYALRPAADVPGVVTNNAGAMKGPFAP